MNESIKKIKEQAKRRSLLSDITAWSGPKEDGITQSILSQYFVCPERFRLKFVEGLSSHEGFSHNLEYGNMWHECEEHLKRKEDWKVPLLNYAKKIAAKFPFEQEQIEKWYQVCKVQFEIYSEYWQEDSSKSRKPIYQEKEFKIRWHQNIILRGKWDAVDYWKDKGIVLTENKSKGTIDEDDISSRLTFDLQTGFYLVALKKWIPSMKLDVDPEIYGINYNVVRRPLSGGRGSIRRHKATKTKPEESSASFYSRLKEIIEDDPEYFFMRWDVKISDEDIDKFEKECLKPILLNLLDDYQWWKYCFKFNKDNFDFDLRNKRFPKHQRRHFRTPYGIWNTISQGVPHDLDRYLQTGNKTGLTVIENFFPELSEE